MEMLGINGSMLALQAITIILFIGLPIIALVDLATKKINGTPLALWVLVICTVPLLGAIAYWIIKPIAESKI